MQMLYNTCFVQTHIIRTSSLYIYLPSESEPIPILKNRNVGVTPFPNRTYLDTQNDNPSNSSSEMLLPKGQQTDGVSRKEKLDIRRKQHIWIRVLSRELTYPTLGKGKSSSNMIFDGIC